MTNCYILCDGGFGNRYGTLLSGLLLSDLTNSKPIVMWPENNWCGAGYDDLFSSSAEQMSFDYRTFFQTHNTVNVIHHNQFHQHLDAMHPDNFDLIQILLALKNTGHDLFYFNNSMPAWMSKETLIQQALPKAKLRRELEQRAQDIVAANTSNRAFLGLHIRRTDFGDQADQFESSWHKLIDQAGSTKVFVCSDDKVKEEQFAAQHSNVFYYAKTSYVEKLVPGDWSTPITDSFDNVWPYNIKRSRDSVLEAMVDLLILSQSNIVPSNTRSSFLGTATFFKQARMAGQSPAG